MAYNDQLLIRVDAGMRDRIDAAIPDGMSRSEWLRRALQVAIEGGSISDEVRVYEPFFREERLVELLSGGGEFTVSGAASALGVGVGEVEGVLGGRVHLRGGVLWLDG